MVAVRVVQVAVYQIVDVVAVGNGRMTTSRSMHMTFVVAAAGMFGRTRVRVGGRHFQRTFVHMPFVGVVQVAVVQIINMVAVLDGLMAAAGAMHVRMVLVDHMGIHEVRFLFGEVGSGRGSAEASAAR